ncbi:FG-GAP-like repeat-containing protein [Pantanalinema rosaneae CENA516]|uniref:FG-GAP-like repeat-containing protein n=1 Tax=Pantanalinema rosaneae TaxID=1620701 RepID=UPI003D6EBD11
MADNGLFDNNATTQRLITVGSGLQTFKNTGTDTSYSLGPGDSDDYYRIQLGRSSSLILTLTELGGNADLQLLDSSGNPLTGELGSSTNPGALSESIITDVLNPGTYYIRVFTSDPSTLINYTLGVNSIGTSRSDIIWRNATSGDIGVWRMDNTTLVGSSLAGPNLVSTDWQIIDVADFDGDGQDDYLWRNNRTGVNGVWRMTSNGSLLGTFSLPTISNTWTLAGAADFSGDGILDLVWRNSSTGENAMWVMNSDRSTISSAFLLPAIGGAWRIETIGDFNRDGLNDLVWRNSSTGQNAVWFFNGTTYASAASLTSRTGSAWKIAECADFNGDGHLDLIWRNTTTGANEIWYMNGITYLSTAPFSSLGVSWHLGGVIKTAGTVDLAGNTLGTAFNIGVIDDRTGNDAATYTDTIGSVSDQNDYYRFTLQTSSTVSISLAGLQANADLWLIRDVNNNGELDDNDVTWQSNNPGTANELLSEILSAGTYFIRVRSAAPSADTVTPYSLAIAATQAPPIDLVATNLTATRSTVDLTQSTQRNISITYTVQYTDPNPPQGGRTFSVGIYLSRDAVITPTDRLFDLNGDGVSDENDYITFTNVQPGTFQRTISLTLPPNSDNWWGGNQTYYLGVLADPGNTVVETFENNNYRALGIGITGTVRPDAVGNGFDIVQSSQTIGGAITLRGTITNQGTVATGTTGLRFQVNFYLSADDVLDGGDHFLTTASFAPLAAGASANFISTTAQVPGTTQASFFTNTDVRLPTLGGWDGWQGNGRYYILMWIDPSGLDIPNEGPGGRENNRNYGRTMPLVFNSYIGSNVYRDFDFIDVTGL